MKKLLFLILLLFPSLAFAQPAGKGFVSLSEEDGSPQCFGWQIKSSNGSVTDNGDGTCSISAGGTPAGSDTQVQYNNAGAFGGDAGLTYAASTDTLTVSGVVSTPTVIGGTATTSDLNLKTTSGVGASGADMHFLVGNNGATEAMTILNSGFVGVGGSPIAKFHVQGESTTNDFIGLFTRNGITAEPSAIAPNSGNMLSVQGSGSALLMGRDITNDVEFIMGASSALVAFVGSMSAHDLQLRTANSTKMTIKNSTGWTGIGTTNPESLLEVQGAEATDSCLDLDADDGDDVADTYFMCSTAATNNLDIKNGTTTIASFTSGGNFSSIGTITSSRTSDLGWSVVLGADTACNTTCTSACAVGFDTGTLGVTLGHIVGCADASADECLCAGGS